MDDLRLDGQVAVISGGGRGIGESMPRLFAAAGAKVATCARGPGQIERVAAEVRELGGTVLPVVADLTVEADVTRFADRVVAEFGAVDILVNCAGGNTCISTDRLPDTDPDDWRYVMDFNYFGTYLLTRALLPHLNRGGRIINFGSGAGHRAGASEIGYRAAKAAVSMFTRSLALEVWEDGITVNELVPGAVATTGLNLGKDRSSDAAVQAELEGTFLGAEIIRHPDAPAEMALWLATRPPGGPTGQTFSLHREPQ